MLLTLKSGCCVTLPDGTDLVLGHLAISAAEEQFVYPPDHGNPPEIVAMASEFADVWPALPPACLRTGGPTSSFGLTPERIQCPVPVR